MATMNMNMNMNRKYDIDIVIDKLELDINQMSSNKDIQENILKYKDNLKKILEVKENLKYLQNELLYYKPENNPDELISNTQFMDYIMELDEVKKHLDNLKLHKLIKIYKTSIRKIMQCKDYLENQKIEIIVID